MWILNPERLRHAAFLILALLGGPPALAGGFHLAPIIQDVQRDQSVASYYLTNDSGETVTVQVTPWAWEAEGQQRKLSATDSLLVVPPMVTLAPGRKQLVRVALRGERPEGELAYRLHFQEVPGAALGGVAVQTLLKVDVPLFFSPSKVKEQSVWQIRSDAAANLWLVAANTGTRSLRHSGIALKNADGRILQQISEPVYILPGGVRQWQLDREVARTLQNPVVEVVSSHRREMHPVTIE